MGDMTTSTIKPWTLADLRDLVRSTRRLPGDVRVVIASDPECNHYLPVAEVTTGLYSPGFLHMTPEQSRQYAADTGLSLGEVLELQPKPPPDAALALCLIPLNDE